MATDGTYSLDKTLVTESFLDGNGSLSVGIKTGTDAETVKMIATNKPLDSTELSGDHAIHMEAKAGASASGIKFLNGGTVGFKASGDIYADLDVFPDPTSDSFKKALETVADTKFSVASDDKLTNVMLRWGADVSASGSGTLALAPGTVDFSAGGTGEFFYCVLRQVPRTTGTDDAFQSVVKSWKLPAHVHTANDLPSRTHILSEVGGSLKASISGTFGHEFNWVKQISVGAIAGDVGLKLHLGVKTSFDMTLQGKYAVAVSRESDANVIRVRLYKLKLNDFNFALSASAAATIQDPSPKNFDDLLKATIGVHAAQILSDIEDPNIINTWINKFGTQYVTDLFKKVTGLDLAEALTKVQSFTDLWKNLPSSISSQFVKLVEKAEGKVPDFTDIEAVSRLIANDDAQGLSDFLTGKIKDLNIPFADSPLGTYLDNLTETGALSLLKVIPQGAKDDVGKVLNFLGGDGVKDLLTNIVNEIDSRLGLDKILATLQGDPATVLDKLLFSRLETFLNKTPLAKDIKQLQQTITSLQKNVSDLYAKAKKALDSTYTAQLNATYEKSTTDTALVDASFDFGPNGDDAHVAGELADLLSGKLGDFLATPTRGVTLTYGTLTHEVKRHSHVDLTLPFLKVEGDWISNAATSFNAIDENGGRLTTYHLQQTGTDIRKITLTSLWTGRNWRSSSITLGGQLQSFIPGGGAVNSGVIPGTASGIPAPLRIFRDTAAANGSTASSTMSVRIEAANMTLRELDAGIEPFAVRFMKKAFPADADFDKWATTGKLLVQPGNTLVSLDVTLPGSVPLAWLKNAVSDRKAPVYKDLSLNLQLILKTYLVDYYFRDLARYHTVDFAHSILLYASIPPANANLVGGTSISDAYWEFDRNFAAMAQLAMTNPFPGRSFTDLLTKAHTRLLGTHNPDAQFYDPQGATTFFSAATTGANLARLKSQLLQAEFNVITDACNAAADIAEFNIQKAANKPGKALVALAEFGNHIVSAFNQDLGGFPDDDALQRLSPIIFALAARTFDNTVPVDAFDSLLNVTVLQPSAAFPADFPDFAAPAEKDILVSRSAPSFS